MDETVHRDTRIERDVDFTDPRNRPQTPHLDVVEIREFRNFDSTMMIKNFSAFMKQIIDNNNENFLNGDINVIEYIISKYTDIPINEIKNIEKFSMKIQTDLALLNIFADYLPKLKELKLNESKVPCISDLGSNFSNLITLHVNYCQLKDLSGTIVNNFRYTVFPEARGV
jgi:hypothetical protein